MLSVLDATNGVLNAGNAIDSDPNSHSSLVMPLIGVSAEVQQTVYYESPSNNSDTFYLGLAFPASILDLSLAQSIYIESYNGTTWVDSTSLYNLIDLNLLGLLQPNQKINLAYSPGASVNRIRIRMENLVGVSATSLDFYSITKNPPIATTTNASAISATIATLNGSISDTYNCMNSTYGFEYSTDPNFGEGTGTFIASSNLSNGDFSYNLTGLTPETTYYYRAVGHVNFDGNNFSYYGEVKSFTTEIITWDGTSWNNLTGPTITDNARISGDYDTAIDGAINVKDLNITTGNTLTIDDGSPLTISGDITGDDPQSVDAQNGSITYNACEGQILNGTDFLNNTIKNVTANLCVDEVLTVQNQVNISESFTISQGDLEIDNASNLYFLSDANKTARFGTIADCTNTDITYTGTGSVTAERFIPAGSTSGGTQIRRAYRFLSSSIDTQGYGSINDNWQEGEQLVNAYSVISNNPGYGTHITGFNNASTTPASASGLDYNATGVSSMYCYNNAVDDWEVVTNTNDPLIAGKGYYILVRGDRTVDMSSNTPPPTDTRLRATGKLKICDQNYSSGTDLANLDGEFSFIGNPYQSSIDVETILDEATNVNDIYYWYLDPNIGTNGGYVTVDVSVGNGSSTPTSNANKYLQAGQAMFIQNIADTPSLSINESHKANDDNLGVFRPSTLPSINYDLDLKLIRNEDGLLLDGTKLKFSEEYSNVVDSYDATKLFNSGENISVKNNNQNLSIERRYIPNHLETIQLQLDNTNEISYQLKLDWTEIPNKDAYLMDSYLNTEELLITGNNSYNFIQNSTPNRFSIQFRDSSLSTAKHEKTSLSVYPNPTVNGEFAVSLTGYNNEHVTISIYNTLGQRVYFETHQIINNQIHIKSNLKTAGIYTLQLTNKEIILTQKIINR